MEEGADIVQVLLAFLIVIGMIGLFALALRKFASPAGLLTKLRGENAKIQLLDICPIDQRHKAVVVVYNNTEYFVLISPEGATVLNQKPAERNEEDAA